MNMIKNMIRKISRKATGFQEEIDTLYYFLDTYADITSLGPTKNEDLRLMQLAMLELMRVFDKLCKENDLTYWIDSGNLIGAVRHRGFIPWDDDVDVCMLRNDYNKIMDLFKERLDKYGIVLRSGGYFDNMSDLQRLAMGYKTLETGIWMDIFPVDSLYTDNVLDDETERKIGSYHKKYKRYFDKAEYHKDTSSILEKKNIMFDNMLCADGNDKHRVLLYAPEFWKYTIVIDYNDVFPLRDLDYEDIPFPAPDNFDLYLTKMYGKEYMSFPRGGITHHTDPDGLYAYERAKAHGINMREVIEYLKEVREKI